NCRTTVRRTVEPPAPGLAAVLDWSSRARGAVFVARGGLEQERERIVREAQELGATFLGEQFSTVRRSSTAFCSHVPEPGPGQAPGHGSKGRAPLSRLTRRSRSRGSAAVPSRQVSEPGTGQAPRRGSAVRDRLALAALGRAHDRVADLARAV